MGDGRPPIDEVLGGGRRGLRSRPGSLLLGPTGARLWADVLDEQPGFVGTLDFVHKVNIPSLFTTTVSPAPRWPGPPAEVSWFPSHLAMGLSVGAVRLTERKLITWDDVAVSEQRWVNDGPDPVTLGLTVDRSWVGAPVEGAATGRREIPQRDFTVRAIVTTDSPALWSGIELAAGEERTVRVAAAVGLVGTDSEEKLAARAATQVRCGSVDRAIADYQQWFDEVPVFTSSDPSLDRLWWYRWFLVRHNLAAPARGGLADTVVYEGRSHKMTKAPWAPTGWEFSKHIPLSTPMHVLELRWHHDPGLGAGVVRSVIGRQGEDGQFYSGTVNETMHPYANFMGWAAWQYAVLHGAAAIEAAVPALKRQVRGEREHRVPDPDELPVQVDHRLTGKEYQPSYWYFAGYPADAKDPAGYTPLKRVDRAVYQYRNAAGVARLCAALGDTDAAEFEGVAARVSAAVLDKQWHPGLGFFLDLHHRTDEPALVRNVVGFYPWWAGIAGEEHRAGFEQAFGPEFFGTAWPLPSVAVDCPVYEPAGGWQGRFYKGRNGCMWDGPTWPYTNSVVLDAVGEQSRRSGHRYDALFGHLFRRNALLHFAQHDGRTPYLVEHYDSGTGEPISDEPDYNHSYVIDLMVRFVAGLSVDRAGSGAVTLTLDPLDLGLGHLALTDLRIDGHLVDVVHEDGVAVLVVDGARYESAGGAPVVVTIDPVTA